MNDFHSGITLPSAFAPTTPASLSDYVGACLEFLTSPLVSSLLNCHPNDIAVDGPSSGWLHWWSWAARGQRKWRLLVSGWPQEDEDEVHLAAEIPPELRKMLETIDSLTLPRAPNSNVVSPPLPPTRGMSPKKSHEVSQMSAYIGSLLSQTRDTHEIKHVVDVGAGQGYLSRALSEHPHSMNVLALDFSEVQTKGAERRGRNIKKKASKSIAKATVTENVSHSDIEPTRPETGTVTHEMVHIDPQTLESAISSWVSAASSSSQGPTPVLLVALHACGSLTPDILRSYVTSRKIISVSTDKSCYNWYPAGTIVVGCCYNLMSPESDFPMSTKVSNEMKIIPNHLLLSYNHRSLAAQSPSQWVLNTSTTSAAKLAIRKVVYRALLERQAASVTAGLKVNSERYGKVGRLHDSAYASLHTFISRFNAKNGAEVPTPPWEDVQDLASCLEVLHVLRSRIGPVVESLILVDRWLYLAENLPADDILSVNLFDQNCGSARNIALVGRPHLSF